MKKLLCLRLILRTAVWLALVVPVHAAAAPRPVDVKTTRPARGDITRFVTLPGTIKANQQATLYAKVPGYLKSIAVDKGDKVEAGQQLGEIEVPELAAELPKYRAELARAEAELKVAELESGRLARAQKHASDLVLPQAVDNAEARLLIARAGIESAKANIERVETLLRYSRLAAPFSGTVTMRYVDVGAFIPAATGGSPAGAAVLTLMNFTIVRAQVAVPELEATLVRDGQPVKVSVEGLPGKVFEGTVTRQSFALDDATKTMLAEADLPNPDLALRPGMYATLKIGVEKHTNTLLIPIDALVMEKLNPFAFVDTGGKARKTVIQTGFNDGSNVEVLSGLKGDETVILVGKMTLTDGVTVNGIGAK